MLENRRLLKHFWGRNGWMVRGLPAILVFPSCAVGGSRLCDAFPVATGGFLGFAGCPISLRVAFEDTRVSSGGSSLGRFATARLRGFRPGDRGAVAALLPRIGAWYPGGAAWLDVRLGDALGGRATALLAFRDDLLAGIAIDTPKGVRHHKLSTIYVAPWARRQGVGSALFGWLNRYWVRSGATAVHVTLDAAKDDARPFFEHWGFGVRLTIPNRYGPGRAEKVLTWDSEFGEALAAHIH